LVDGRPPVTSARRSSAKPGWERLWTHSYRLGVRWLARGARRGWRARRIGVARLLVPLDPWRYYELGRVADAQFEGLCLDVSSPKLLPSLLQYEGKGNWIAIDLFEHEIEAWKEVDPSLRLEVHDATRLPYASDSFDHCICVSVVEHVPNDGDSKVLGEIWRTLRPGGALDLTTNVSREFRELFVGEQMYGEASKRVDGKVFFERHYGEQDLETRLLAKPWQVLEKEFARQIDSSIEERFYRRAPWSYVYGCLLRLWCPGNFELGDSTELLRPGEQGVVYLRLKKPDSGE
jgi:SAM-dependent methyltransferase